MTFTVVWRFLLGARVLIYIFFMSGGKNCNNYAENIRRHRALVALATEALEIAYNIKMK